MTNDIAIRYCDEYLARHIAGIDKEFLKKAKEALQQEPKSEWQQDHEILKAYSDGANEVLDKIRAEIEQAYCKVTNDYDHGRNYGLYMAIQIIDKYKAEGSGEE
ncbi:MAG: hypothetical protein J6S67_16915 [Methanobrevibacter sp.]|nr:hypothetical protein [Methanobrevibacter sp.]